jgi:hypothetical protein
VARSTPRSSRRDFGPLRDKRKDARIDATWEWGAHISVRGLYSIDADEPPPRLVEAELPSDQDLTTQISPGGLVWDELNPVRSRILEHVVMSGRIVAKRSHRPSRLHRLSLVRLLLGYQPGERHRDGLPLRPAGPSKEHHRRGERTEDPPPAPSSSCRCLSHPRSRYRVAARCKYAGSQIHSSRSRAVGNGARSGSKDHTCSSLAGARFDGRSESPMLVVVVVAFAAPGLQTLADSEVGDAERGHWVGPPPVDRRVQEQTHQ